ncbi:MAG: enoyl-CoA hydratase/isomerase family protein [Rhizobiaceae bacterium]|nr:enoyl-CoA hydratase/isomerase family protein [Rhizobiaceae bacterium]
MNQHAKTAVLVSRAGAVLVAEIDNPPVNALSRAVRAGLSGAIDELERDDSVDAMVIAARGKLFSAGADITEFGSAMREPFLGEIVARLDSSRKPVVAAIAGKALGGGLELALACHGRIASPTAAFALPEVKLGILPGSGGVVRLPRLVDAEHALAMIAEGKELGTADALDCGLVDRIADADLQEAAIAYAKELAASSDAPPCASARPFPPFGQALQDEARNRYARKFRGREAPQKAVDLFAMAAITPFEEAARHEYSACLELLSTSQSRALRYSFQAEKAARKIDNIPEDVQPREIARAGVAGSGTMGRGIAIALLDAGIDVTLYGRSETSLAAARETIARTYSSSVKRGRLTEEAAQSRLSRLKTTTDVSSLGSCDIVVETISEHLETKRELIATIDGFANDETIIATNTSFLDLEALAAATSRPENFAGMHFFNPANLMNLVENVRARGSSARTLVTLAALAQRLGKVAVTVGPTEGFVANRMLAKRTREALFLLQDGATPSQVDRVLTEFGFPIGPFALADMAGLDVLAATRASRFAGMSDREQGADIVEQLVAAGRLGRKSGQGYYRYDSEGRQTEDSAVADLLDAHRRQHGIEARQVSDDEVLERCLLALVNEGASLVDAGTVGRISDIDVVWTRGFGFPAHLGGPMFWASERGLPFVRERLRQYAKTVGEEFFAPATLIDRLAAANERLVG